jgi:hypothetical protein
MFVILSQKVDVESSYSDDLFKTYHYPSRYKNLLHTGDVFVYYQGNRYEKEHRYYFGTGVVGAIHTPDGESYYAELTECQRFSNHVSIYLPDSGYVEQKGYVKIRKSINPPWQSSIRPLSQEAYEYILSKAGVLIPEGKNEDVNFLKNDLKRAVKAFYIGKDDDAVLEIAEIAKKIAQEQNLKQAESIRVSEEVYSSKMSHQSTGVIKYQLFDYCKSMKMSYSYKPVLILAVVEAGDEFGGITIEDAVGYFRDFYRRRREQGLKIEHGNCIYQRPDITNGDIADNIITNPVRALVSSGYFLYDTDIHTFKIDPSVWSTLNDKDKSDICAICRTKLEKYYSSK